MANSSGEVDESEVMTRATLQGLYASVGVETLHVVTNALGVVVKALIVGEHGEREIALPEGHYIIARVVERPTSAAGLYGVRAPTGGPRVRRPSTALRSAQDAKARGQRGES